MSFSFTLVLGLLLLAPGLALFAAIYHGSHLGPVKSPPPRPGSILALAIISIGALFAHLAGATVFLVQDLVCHRRGACLAVDFNPNAYVVLFNAAHSAQAVTGAEVVCLLASLAVLTAATFAITRLAGASPWAPRLLHGLLYGWLADVAVASGPDEAVLAYVLSDVQDGGTIVGYEGTVANMTTNADREISSILLAACETFYLRVTPKGVVRNKALRAESIPQLYLDQSRIKNIAFEKVRFEEDDIG
jgi:hypothetical protein